MAAPVIDYRGTFRFPVPPEALWATLEQTGEFEAWWGWLGEFRLEGQGLEEGSVMVGVASPPVPYRLRVRVELGECVRPSSIDATVLGDLKGHGRLELSRDGDGTVAVIAWQLEMMQRPMRLASRFAHPMLRWGHDRVVEATVRGFRRHLSPQVDESRPGRSPA